MGRPPASGAHAFRFFPKEVQEMEKFLEDGKGAIPPRDTISSLAEKFSAAPERAGKILVQWKQVWTWFQNRRYAQKAKGTKVPGNPAPAPRDDSGAKRIVTNSAAVPSGRKVPGASEMEFEAKSARDGAWGKQNYVLKFADYANPLIWFNYLFLAAHKHAGWKSTGFLKGLHHSWDSSSQQSTSKGELTPMPNNQGIGYDVASFVTHRMFESGDPLAELMPLSVSAEVRVRFAGFGAEEDEWVNVKNCVRQRSLPCEASECVAVLSGDLILCFQEGKEQALYFDAHVLDAQRRRHDARGCRCRFLVRYDHDQSEEIVPLSKICRRPETDYRLQLVHVSKELSSIELDHGSQQIKDAPAAPICHFGAATQEELHLSPEISKNTSQVVEENVQSLTAPKTSVLQEQEGLSAESQTNLFATEINTSQKIVAPAFIDMDKASNSMVDTTAKSKVQD